MPPSALRSLYYARVDPHLTYACEVIIRLPSNTWDLLTKTQLKFLRRMLQLNPRSTTPALFTETGILPIRARRIILALRFLTYACNGISPLVQAALTSSWSLSAQHSPCWFSELQEELDNVDVDLQPFTVLTRDACQQLEDTIIHNVSHSLSSQIMDSQRLQLLATCRLHHSSRPIIAFQKYLSCPVPSHATAIVQLLASDHPLAIESLRRSRHHIPRENRLCRFCPDNDYIEDESHILFECKNDPIITSLREDFLTIARQQIPSLPPLLGNNNCFPLVRVILDNEILIPAFGKMVYCIFQRCKQFPIRSPLPHCMLMPCFSPFPMNTN